LGKKGEHQERVKFKECECSKHSKTP
jgi:hypothetical protein